MTELKTLKDCKDKEEARAEAIKLYNLLNDHYKFNKEMPFMAKNDSERKFAQKIIRWQNNLTEEDLK